MLNCFGRESDHEEMRESFRKVRKTCFLRTTEAFAVRCAEEQEIVIDLQRDARPTTVIYYYYYGANRDIRDVTNDGVISVRRIFGISLLRKNNRYRLLLPANAGTMKTTQWGGGDRCGARNTIHRFSRNGYMITRTFSRRFQ